MDRLQGTNAYPKSAINGEPLARAHLIVTVEALDRLHRLMEANTFYASGYRDDTMDQAAQEVIDAARRWVASVKAQPEALIDKPPEPTQTDTL